MQAVILPLRNMIKLMLTCLVGALFGIIFCSVTIGVALASDCPDDLPEVKCRVDSVWDRDKSEDARVGDLAVLNLHELCQGGKGTFQRQGRDDLYTGFDLRQLTVLQELKWNGAGIPTLQLITGGECITDTFTIKPDEADSSLARAEYVRKQGCGFFSWMIRRKYVSIKLFCHR